MNTKLLRQKILDLAIRGKLTDQRKSDGTARELLEQISASRHLERDAKSAKSKNLVPIDPLDKSEAPFEIPDNWEWVKLGDFLDVRDGTHDSPKYVENGYPFVTSKNLVDGRIDFSTCKQISKSDYDKFNERSHVDDGDILYAMIGSIGNAVLVKKDRDFAIKNVALFKKKNSQTNMGYVYYWLCFIEKTLKGNAAGGLQPFISLSMFREQAFPLPPLAEQQRIVAKIEEAFAEIDAVEKNKELLKTHIKQTRQKILDLAIHGKLVPQDENDEPASVLLEKILQEKAQTENKKSPKKKKTDDIATSDNRPYEKIEGVLFEIPEKWMWVRLGDILAPKQSKQPTGLSFKYIDIDSIDNTCCKIRKPKIIETKKAPSRASRFTQKGDILFSLVRPYLRNIAKVEENDCIASTGFYVCSPLHVNNDYCYYLLISNYAVDGLNQFMKGDNSPSISSQNLTGYIVPLPPFNEQSRIVSKIEELFSTLDQVERNLI